MKYQILAGDQVLGTTSLETYQLEQKYASGRFAPSDGFKSVRHIFALFAESLASKSSLASTELLHEYVQQRDALGLKLVDSKGRLIPSSVINIKVAPELLVEVYLEESGL